MPTFTPSGGQPLLVRGTIQENFDDKMPLTSRYAWPRRSESSLSNSSFPNRNSKNPFFARHNPHPQRVRHLKGLLDVPVCTVIDSGVEENVGRYMVCTPTIDQMRQRPLKSSHGLRLPINADTVVFAKEKAVPSIGLGKNFTLFVLSASGNEVLIVLSNDELLLVRKEIDTVTINEIILYGS